MSARDHRHEQERAGAAISESAATAADGRGSGAQGAVRPHRLDAREEAEAKAMSARGDKLAAALRARMESER